VTVDLRPTPARAGALGFGCADVFRLPTPRARRHVLETAFAAGITHFDVAPMYGLGAAERELGAFVAGRRDQVVIATKFGIDVTAAAGALRRVQGPVRRALEARPALRARARAAASGPGSGRAGALLYRSRGYDADAARASLERSLRALRTDHVDLLLLHDPTPAARIVDGVGDFLEWARSEGLIGAWGVAGEPADVAGAAERLTPDPSVLQVRDDVFTPLPDDDRAVWRITFGTLGSPLARIAAHLHGDPGARDRWTAAIGRDAGDPEVLAALLLRHARLRNPTGTTLFGTGRPHRLERAVQAASSSAADDAVAALVALVEAELDGAARPGAIR
jgi:D-threo-aldose 1-dehydrogenase